MLPIELRKAIDQAFAALSDSERHDLAVVYRKEIYDAFQVAETKNGQVRLTKLAILTAQYVMPNWCKIWPYDNLPKILLHHATKRLERPENLEEAKEKLETAWKHLEQKAGEPEGVENEGAIAAGITALKALEIATGIIPLNNLESNAASREDDLDPWHMDIAICAADAYSEPIWVSKFNSGKRYEFWRWWLTEAIPQAWESVTEFV